MRHHPTLHCRQNLGSRLAEQAHPNDSTGKHARKPVWVQVQRRNDRRDLRAETNSWEGKRREQNMGLYAAFVDLTKAFDIVSRDGLWKLVARLGCPRKFLTILRQLHEGQ